MPEPPTQHNWRAESLFKTGTYSALPLISDEKIGFIKGKMCDDKTLRLNHSSNSALLHQSEDMIGIVEALADDRPPAVDPEDHQYKVECDG